MDILKTAQRLTTELEQQLEIEFKFEYFRTFSVAKNLGWHEKATGVVQLPAIDGILLREFLYHELGHVLLSTYNISKVMLRPFTKRDPHIVRYYFDIHSDKWEKRESGFISGYAAISTQEDFCETFSAWITNDFRTSGTFRYNGHIIDASDDSRLRKKIVAVKKLVKHCQQIDLACTQKE